MYVESSPQRLLFFLFSFTCMKAQNRTFSTFQNLWLGFLQLIFGFYSGLGKKGFCLLGNGNGFLFPEEKGRKRQLSESGILTPFSFFRLFTTPSSFHSTIFFFFLSPFPPTGFFSLLLSYPRLLVYGRKGKRLLLYYYVRTVACGFAIVTREA